jgi:hypothetical protein
MNSNRISTNFLKNKSRYYLCFQCTLPCDDTAHMIIPVPGGSWAHEGPSGVIVCCANYLVYKRPGKYHHSFKYMYVNLK